jgi:peroxiredoxin
MAPRASMPCADRKWVVVVFLGVDCPLAKLYGGRLTDLARIYEQRGVAVLGIHANQNESPADLARYAREHKITFPLLRDVGNIVADQFGATRTPEAFILDEQRAIRYRGRIDDQYDVGFQRPSGGRRDLIEALDELLAGKAVSRPVTQAAAV